MHGFPGIRATRIRTLVSGLLTATLLGALIAPAATLASGSAPTPGVDNYTVLEDSGLNSFNLLSNDTDPEQDSLTVTGFGNWTAGWGTKTWAADGAFTYTPAANYCKASGLNNTYYFVYDGSNTVMGYIHIGVTCVNDQPVFTPGADVNATEDDPAYSAAWATGVGVGGGADEAGQTLTFHVSNDNNSLFSVQPAISSSGVLTYTLAPNQNGSALVDVYLTDSGSNVAPNDNVTDTVQFTIDVAAVADAPVAVDDTPTVNEDAAATTIDVLGNDSDGDGDTLTISDVTTPANGTVVVAGDALDLTYQPDANYCGTDTFDYTVTDGGLTDVGTVTVTVTCQNDLPNAVDDTVGSGTEDQADPILVAASDLLANDSDVEDANVDLAFDAWGDTTVGGSVFLNVGTGNFEFTLDADFCGTASFDYTIIDLDGGTGTAVNEMAVECVNDAPIADDQSIDADENVDGAPFNLTATDPDSDTFTFAITVQPDHGTLNCDDAGTCTYIPDPNYHGSDSFSFSANDGSLTSLVDGVVTITVAEDLTGPVAAAPTAAFGTGRVDETAPIRLTWAADDASGVASYEVQVKIGTGSWTPVYTGSATAVTKFYAFNRALLWRVRATDSKGNVGDWATTVSARTIVAYQGGSPVTYTGTWGTYPSAGSSGTGYRYTLSAGKSATLRLTGLQVLYVAPKTAGSGSVIVYVDNVRIGTTFSLRAASTTLGQIIARKTWGTSGTHTIKIVSVTSGKQTNLDAFVVLK